MPLESGTFISDLVAANPPGTDGLAQTDDHLRLLKNVLKTTFPNLNGAVSATDEQLSLIGSDTLEFADGGATAPLLRSKTEPTLGFFRPSAGKLQLSNGKRLLGNGTVPIGSLHSFPKVPPSFLSGGTAGAAEYLELDGSLYLIADHPDLAAFLGTTFGGNGTTTFGVPNTKDTGRFLRSRTGSLAVGTPQANVIKNHVHALTTATAASGGSAHTHTGTTNAGSAHIHDIKQNRALVTGGSNFNAVTLVDDAATDLTGQSQPESAHTHTFTTASDGTHTHTLAGNTDNNTGGDATETRPEAFAVILAIKT